MKATLNQVLPRIIGTYLNIIGWVSPLQSGRKAFELFCTPRKGKLKAKDQAYLTSTAKQRVLESTKGPVYTYEWNPTGQKTVLLLHGWESNSARWRTIIPILEAHHFRVIAIDAPAHGASADPLFDMSKYGVFVDATVKAFQPNYLVGHSLGGGTACYFMAHYANDIEKLILLGVPSDLELMVQRFSGYLRLGRRSIKGLRKFFKSKFHREVPYFSAKNFVRSICIPTLIIHDKEDSIASVKDSIAYDALMNDSQLMITQGMGHSLQHQQVYQAILDFFEK